MLHVSLLNVYFTVFDILVLYLFIFWAMVLNFFNWTNAHNSSVMYYTLRVSESGSAGEC